MPAWLGGPCPECGEDMPANLIHCQTCRALLNVELDKSSVVIPAFIPLQEIDNMEQVAPRGFHIDCPHCERELRISRKYAGQQVQCKFCKGPFKLDLSKKLIVVRAFYTDCPHCSEELWISTKYLGEKVACKLCGGRIHLISDTSR